MLKNLDETVHLESEKKQEWIRKVSGERDKGLPRARVAQSAPSSH